MAKIKAVLDQETWSEVDVPDEFQAIVASMCSSDSVITENSGNGQGSVIMANNGVSNVVDNIKESNAEQHVETAELNNISDDVSVPDKSQHLGEQNNISKADAVTSLAQSKSNNTKDRGKSTSQTLVYKDVGYHMVNWLVNVPIYFLHLPILLSVIP